jgi:hypothetical protein
MPLSSGTKSIYTSTLKMENVTKLLLYGVVSFGGSIVSTSPRSTFTMMMLLMTGNRGGFQRQAADKSRKNLQ